MQHSPHEIKERLLGALDKDYNVVDMACVIQVLSLLEKTHITKDALERTRLGKHINELRKRTTDEMLARRAKDLVKSWRKLLEQHPPECVTANGERISPPGPGPGHPASLTNSRSGASLARHRATQESHQSPPISRYKQSAQRSPDVSLSVRTASPLCISASSSPVACVNYAPLKCEEKSQTSPQQRQGNGQQYSSPSVSPNNSKPASPSLRKPGNKSFYTTVDLAKTNVANKRLRKDETNCILPKRLATPPVNSVHAVNGWDNSNQTTKTENSRNEKCSNEKQTALLLPSSRLQKVKTTRQLIDELQNKKGSAVAHGSLSSITLPPTACENRTESLSSLKKTGRKNLALDAEMNKTKSELMDRFLKSSVSSQIPIANESQPSASDSVPARDIDDELREIFCTLPPLDPEAINWDQEAFVPAGMEVTDQTVERYCKDQWEHINGTYDCEDRWRCWDEITTSKTTGSEVLQILPYVNIDW